MFSKAVLTVKDLVMPTGLRLFIQFLRNGTCCFELQLNEVETWSQVKRLVTILTDRALKMYRERITTVRSTYGECHLLLYKHEQCVLRRLAAAKNFCESLLKDNDLRCW